MSTILEVRLGTIRAESRSVNVAANQAPRTKIYADTDKGIVPLFVQSDRVPAVGTQVMVEHHTGDRDDGTTWESWQIG